MTLNDPREPRGPYTRGAGFGYGWVWIVIIIIIIVAGFGWGGGWWEHGRNTAANPPAHTTGQATTPANPAPKSPAPSGK